MRETVYFGGPILTMEKEAPQVEALLIRGGRIVCAGSREEAERRAGAGGERIDLQGKTLLPAFIDPHSHITALASTIDLVPLASATCFDDIVARLCDYRDHTRLNAGDWIVGFGYDHNFLMEKRHPDRTVLDRVSTEHPVLISHASGHMGVANTAALRVGGCEGKVPDPEGGYLEENAFFQFSGGMPGPSPQTSVDRLLKAQDVYLSHGITTIQDGKTDRAAFEQLLAVAQSGRLSADIVCYADLEKAPGLPEEQPACWKKYLNRLKLGGFKIFLDGSPQGETAWLTKPYEGRSDGYCGYPVHSYGEVRNLVSSVWERDAQLLAHCNGDAACEQFITAVEDVLTTSGRSDACRPVMIHAQTVRHDQLSRMARVGMIPSFFAAHVYHWGDVHLKNLGRARADRISPARAAQKRGMPYTFHQDTPVLPPDMLETVWCAVNRVTGEGVLLGEEERVSVQEALEAVTIHAAYQYFEEDRKGSLKEGKLADLVILSANPLTVPPQDIKNIRVLETVKEGETVYRHPL